MFFLASFLVAFLWCHSASVKTYILPHFLLLSFVFTWKIVVILLSIVFTLKNFSSWVWVLNYDCLSNRFSILVKSPLSSCASSFISSLSFVAKVAVSNIFVWLRLPVQVADTCWCLKALKGTLDFGMDQTTRYNTVIFGPLITCFKKIHSAIIKKNQNQAGTFMYCWTCCVRCTSPSRVVCLEQHRRGSSILHGL